MVLTARKLDATSGAVLKHEGLKQVVIAAVPGKKAVVGNLILASSKYRSYAPDEFEFLATCGQQLGLALENLHLVEEILRSHRQWSNTFESIQDLVLLHDADFHILKANPALLERLGKSQSEVVGQLCQAVLPTTRCNGPNALTAEAKKMVSSRARILLADIPSLPLLPTRTRARNRRERSTWSGTSPNGVPPNKNIARYLSRCRKGHLLPAPLGHCSIAMMPLCECWAFLRARNYLAAMSTPNSMLHLSSATIFAAR